MAFGDFFRELSGKIVFENCDTYGGRYDTQDKSRLKKYDVKGKHINFLTAILLAATSRA